MLICSPLTSAQGRAEQASEVATGATFADARAEGLSWAAPQLAMPSIKSEPTATEEVSYGIARFKHRSGKPLVYFAYWKDHFALYGTGCSFIDAHSAELKAYGLSKGTIRFPADQPIPDRLVTKIVKARLAEVEKPA